MSSGPYASPFVPFGPQERVTGCSWCGRVQDAAGMWSPAPEGAPAADVSHSICPDCLRTRFPDLAREMQAELSDPESTG